MKLKPMFCPHCEVQIDVIPKNSHLAACDECGSKLQPLPQWSDHAQEADHIDGYDRDDLGLSPDF